LEPFELILLGVTFFVAQFVYEIERRLKGNLEAQVVRKMSKYRAMWDILAIIATVAGISIFVFGILNWIWWKVIILWAIAGIVGSFWGKGARHRSVDWRLAEQIGEYTFPLCDIFSHCA
jgi:divalent metal cation (Fe/Co/Zn/Cd) transporter